MTEFSMKPYDPEHKGEFCTRDGRSVCIIATDRKAVYSIVGFVLAQNGKTELLDIWTAEGKDDVDLPESGGDIMCVVPKREAWVRWVNSLDFALETQTTNGFMVREVLPDDISQEKARAVIEAARAVINHLDGDASDALSALRAALGDDA